MTEDWPTRVRRLEEEVAGLRRAMRTRGLIEQAKGMIAERIGCDPEAAFDILAKRSQRTNVPLVSIAADVVAATPAQMPASSTPVKEQLIDTSEVRLADSETQPDLHVITGYPAGQMSALPTTVARRLRLAIAALDAASNLDELTQAIAHVGLHDFPGAVAAIFMAEPDGALRMLSSYGWPPHSVSQWRRVPSQIKTVSATTVLTGQPLIVDGMSAHDYVLIGPGQGRAAFPLAVGQRMIGALQFGWSVAHRLRGSSQLYLAHLAVAAGAAIRRLWPDTVKDDPVASSGDVDWIRAVLDVVHGQAHLLTAIRGASGEVVDFQVEALSHQTAKTESATHGRRLLDCYPHLANNGVFSAYKDIFAHGDVWSRPGTEEEFTVNGQSHRLTLERRAARIAGAVLASWERVDVLAAKEAHLARLEAFGGFGWAAWDLNTGDVQWSPGMYRLIRRDPARAPLTLDALPELAEPADRARMRTFLADAQSGLDSVIEIRTLVEGRPSWLRLICEAPTAESAGKVVNLLAQDVSERYMREERLRMLQSRAAEGRLRLASARELTSRLIELLYPPERIALAPHGSRIIGHHPVHNGEQPLRADFCQAISLPDGTYLLMVGDVFDVGLPAASTAMRILTPAVTLATAGLSLQAVLSALNIDMRHTGELCLASLLLGRWNPAARKLTWASAGHLPPVLLGRNEPELLAYATGPLLGLMDTQDYAEHQTTLETGEAVVFYTDGMLRPGAPDPLVPLMSALDDAYRVGGAEAITQLPLPDGADEACVLVLEACEVL